MQRYESRMYCSFSYKRYCRKFSYSLDVPVVVCLFPCFSLAFNFPSYSCESSLLVIVFLNLASNQMQPLMFNDDGRQRNVTLSASTVHSGYDVTWVSIHAAHYPQFYLAFQMGTNDAYQWLQVRRIYFLSASTLLADVSLRSVVVKHQRLHYLI